MRDLSVFRALAFVLTSAFIVNSTHAQLSGYAVTQRGPDYKVLEKVTVEHGTNRIHKYTVLGNGMNRLDASSNWVECVPEVRVYPAGIVCTGTTYQVIFNPNLNRAGSVDFETSDNQRILSNPLALAYYDPENGRREWIAQIKDCQAAVNGNKVVYADAFAGNGIEASVVYTYGVGRFHQDVVFAKQPGVTPADLGMGSRTRLEVVTEILQSPVPTKKLRVLKREKNSLERSRMVEPDLTDETLNFTKEMGMSLGHVFMKDSAHPDRQLRVPVAKRLRTLPDGRTMLFESTEWSDIRAGLERLPRFAASMSASSTKTRLARVMPTSPPGVKTGETFDTHLADVRTASGVRLAMAAVVPTGVVVDYTILQHSFSTYFPGGTYLIPDDENAELEGPCEFSGTCIFKFGRNGYLWIDSWDPYAGPDLIFTALDDDSVGEIIPGSTGQPTGYYGWLEADFPTEPLPILGSLDFRYMYQAMLIYTWDPDLTLEFPNDVFLRHCDVGFDISGNDNLTFNVAHPYVCDVQTYVVTGDNTYYSPYDPPSAGDCDGDYDNDGMDDGWEMRNFGTTSQAPSGDFDGDGLSNLLEYQLGSDPAAADSDGDGLPDGWEYHWFGNFTHTGSELDASGNTLLYDYENYLDPNGIVFSVEVANNYVKESNAGLHLNVLAGVPSYYAVLVDSTNFRAATWTPYTSSDITANLGSLQGWHELWVGLKGCASNASEAWHWKRLKLDTIPPQLTITSPTNDIVDMPAIQLTGFSIEALRSLRYDLANAFGEVNNQQALVTSHYFDQNAQEFTTNFFQAFDVSLAHGLNTITLHATDLAGNVANMTTQFTLDYSNKTNPPVINLNWPTNQTQISGGGFTWDGYVSDPTARVTVQASGASGDILGTVKRDGRFWVKDIPLNSGANSLTLTVTDAAGNISVTNINVVQSSLALTMDPVPDSSQLWQPTINLTGTISDPTLAVSVNGIEGNNNGNGTWSANNVPTTSGGVASFTVTAYGSTGVAQIKANADKPPKLYMERNEWLWTFDWNDVKITLYAPGGDLEGYGHFDNHEHDTINWTNQLGGCLEDTNYWHDDMFNYWGSSGTCDGYAETAYQWPASEWPDLPNGSGTFFWTNVWTDGELEGDYEVYPTLPSPPLLSEISDVVEREDYTLHTLFFPDGSGEDCGGNKECHRHNRQEWWLNTGGRVGSQQKCLFRLSATADAWRFYKQAEFGHLLELGQTNYVGRIDPAMTPIFLGSLGQLNADGDLWVALEDNTTNEVTPYVRNNDFYTFNIQQQKYNQLDLDVDSDNANGLERSQAEDDIEDQAPGKYISINNGDADADDIPDFADGYNLYGTAPDPSGWPDGSGQSAAFTPMILEIPSGVDVTKAKVRFTYSCSDPGGVTKTANPDGSFTYTPAPNGLRVWIKDGGSYRKKEQVDHYANINGSWQQDGDFIASGAEYWATNVPSSLYIEGIRQGDYTITAELDPDGQSGYISSDTVAVKVVGVDIAMDGNRDGRIDFNDPADAKYLFWVNDDHDSIHYEEGEWHEDDILGYSGGAQYPNCDDNHIGAKQQLGTTTLPDSSNHCRRDLEDFTRVHILVDDHLAQLPGITYWMQSSPSVNIFEAINESLDYLTDGTVADQQIQKLRLLALNGGEVQLPNQYIKTGNQVSPFILEGCAVGKGDLTIIVKKDGNEICRKSVKLELRPITQFYQVFQVATVGQNSTDVSQDYNSDFTRSDDYLLFVHGFNVNATDKAYWPGTVFKRLWWQGYKGHFGFFDWPCVMLNLADPKCYDDSDYNAWRCGAALLDRINQLNSHGHSGKVRILAHSQGNVVAGEALREASGQVVHTYIATQAAIAGDCYQAGLNPYFTDFETPNVFANYPSTGTPCHTGVAQKAGQRFSYFNFDDYALRTAGFGSWEWDNSTRPDDVFADYHYDEGDGIIDTYINSTGDRFRHGQQTLLFPANEFEIYSYAAQARSRALGVLSGITGFSSFNLHDAPLSYNGAHYCHSRQFRSDIVDEQAYWSHVMSDCGFNP